MLHPFGALKPKTDLRDFKIAAAAAQYPESFTCKNLPPVKNQHSVCSCVAHATSAVLETLNKTETNQYVPLSTNFIYGMQGVAYEKLSSGMYLRDACKIVKNYGDPSERTVSGNTEQPKCTEDLKKKLTDDIYTEAKNYRIASYARCTSDDELKHALMTYGPVLGSVKWHEKCDIKDKILYFDKKSKHSYHAIMVYGWNEKGWLCQNSWGKTWNGDGTFIFPYCDNFVELWSFVDAKNSDVIIPKNNQWLDYAYKLFNIIINIIKRCLP